MFSRVRVIGAVGYLLLLVCVFVALAYADTGEAKGGIPLLVLGLPWSLPVLGIFFGLDFIPGVSELLATEGGNFFMGVVICGGLNAAWILGRAQVWELLRRSPVARFATLGVAIALVAVVQAVMPAIRLDAMERSRPKNVPKAAVQRSGLSGVWQHCEYDGGRDVNVCHIWNRGGMVLVEGVFVAYDRGPAVKADQLKVVDGLGVSDCILLANGRLLIPLSREAEIRQSLDRVFRQE